MKKFLMVTTAIAGAAMMSSPASAAIDLNVGGFFSGYVAYADIDGVNNTYDTEFRRDTELHFNGETVLDNGLTVGAHYEAKVENGANTLTGDEAYVYASNAYGRVNFGDEDGAAYLLQVAAPAADSNVDGVDASISGTGETLAYAQITSRDTDRVTYLTPKISGFQAGVSYAPKTGLAQNSGTMSADSDVGGVTTASYSAATGVVWTDNTVSQYKNPYELSARYDGEFQGFGFSAGAGYSKSSLESATPSTATGFQLATGYAGTAATHTADAVWQADDLTQYNFGANVAYQGFTLGGAYVKESTQVAADTALAAGLTIGKADLDSKTYVIGGAYDNGPYHIGVSYLDAKREQSDIAGTIAATGAEVETDRYTVGGGYSFGPGMTFRGAVAWGNEDVTGVKALGAATRDVTGLTNGSTDYKQITVGTDIQF